MIFKSEKQYTRVQIAEDGDKGHFERVMKAELMQKIFKLVGWGEREIDFSFTWTSTKNSGAMLTGEATRKPVEPAPPRARNYGSFDTNLPVAEYTENTLVADLEWASDKNEHRQGVEGRLIQTLNAIARMKGFAVDELRYEFDWTPALIKRKTIQPVIGRAFLKTS